MRLPAMIAGLVLLGLVPGFGELDSAKSSLQDSSKESKGMPERLQELEEGLSLSKTESEYFHKKWTELKLEHEALGMEALTANEKKMQDKLVRLVGEVYRSEKKRLKLQEEVTKLIESGQRLQQSGPLDKAQRRAEYEVSVRAVKAAMSEEEKLAIAPDMRSGSVKQLNDEGLAIGNVGLAQGAQIVMPFRILRGRKVIGRAKLVEVREYTSALLIQDVIEKEKVQMGDRLLLETVK